MHLPNWQWMLLMLVWFQLFGWTMLFNLPYWILQTSFVFILQTNLLAVFFYMSKLCIWRMSFLLFWLLSLQRQLHSARLLLRLSQSATREVPSQLHLLLQQLLLLLHALPTPPRRLLRNGHIRLLRVQDRQHRYGQRSVRLRQVRSAAPGH